jgi:DNA polymerase-3 subunit alpha
MSKVGDVMNYAKEIGQTAVALTDHGSMYGTIEFYKAALKAGIKPIIGCEVYLARNGVDDRSSQSNNMHLVLLAETQEGYYNLARLVSMAHLEGFYYKPRIDKAWLRKYSKGIIALSACLGGEVTEAAAGNDYNRCKELALEYNDIMGQDNFFIEVQDHGIPEQRVANEVLFKVAEDTGIPLVATNDSHYVRRSDAEAHDVLICMQTQSLFTDESRMRYHGDQFYMKTGAEMLSLFPEHPEAISNTVKIADRCHVEFEFDLPAERLHFPEFFPLPENTTKEEHLMNVGVAGLERLYKLDDFYNPTTPLGERVKAQYEYEVDIIKKTNYVNYFLVVADFIQWAKDQGIPVGPGRGSGAGSILAYALNITAIDPLRYNLIFERFLNPDRVSPPDFDIDFEPRRRGDVIQYVRDKYGSEMVGQIITFGTLGAKTLMRDIGRVLNIPLSDCDRIAKLIPDMTKNLKTAQEESPEFAAAVRSDPAAVQIMRYAPALEGLPRHTGMHAAGVVIGDKPLIEIIPLTKDRKEGLTIVQFEKGPTEEIGLLKMDFLGLKNLTTIQEACDSIKRNHGVDLDPMEFPLDDKKTFELFCNGDTVGVFQLESGGMRDTLRQVMPDCIEDIIAILALYRPGPMQFIPTYIKRKHGIEKVKYDHPILEPILKETNGIIVYQEQIQQAARDLAGFSLGEGDILRRAMGKKKQEVMDQQRGKFVKGCADTNGIDSKLANLIFDNITEFAKYGFNKSHSTAYGFVTYQTAYLKAHYKTEFMASLLSGEMTNTEKLPGFINETREMGIEVLPPDVNESRQRFNAIKDKIRFGMAAIKGVGEGAVDAIVAEREAHGNFEGLMDFCARMSGQVNRKAIENLIRSGAFDFTGIHRARLFNGIETALSRASETARDRASGQVSMFDMMMDPTEAKTSSSDEDLQEVAPWTEGEMLAAEKELIGFYISGHPLQIYDWTVKNCALHTIDKIDDIPGGTQTRIAGLVIELRKMFTKKDQSPMAAFRLSGPDTGIDCIVFPDPFEGYGHLLYDDAPVMVSGVISEDRQGGRQIQINEIFSLNKAAGIFTETMRVMFTENDLDEIKLQSLKQLVRRNPGQTPLTMELKHPSGPRIILEADPRYNISPDENLFKGLGDILGPAGVQVVTKPGALLNPTKERKWGGKKK